MTYGVTANGFVRKTSQEIETDIKSLFQSIFGVDVMTTGYSLTGNLIAGLVDLTSTYWEQLELLYQTRWIMTASDQALDDVVSRLGISRILSSYSTVEEAELTNSNSNPITIPNGTQIRQEFTNTVWVTTQEIIIDAESTNTVSLRSLEKGYFTADVDTITQPIDIISGLSSVTNNTESVTGNNKETDTELRIRALSDLYTSKGGSVTAIVALLKKVTGVSYATGSENRTSTTDGNGLAPHSQKFVVVGGTNQDIAECIFNAKTAGIGLNGAVSVTVYDIDNNPHVIKFDRATEQEIYIVVNVVDDGNLPSNAETLIKNYLVAYGETLVNGQDIVNNYLVGTLNPIPGIDSLTIYQGITASPSTTAKISIAGTDIAKIISSNIEVNIT